MLRLQWQKTVEVPQLPWGRAMLCSTVKTYSASVEGDFWKNFQVFLVIG